MSIALNNQYDFPRDEGSDQLVQALRAWGVDYLVSDFAAPELCRNPVAKMPAVELVRQLAKCEYPRVRDASISLFLLHPELVSAILEVYQTSDVWTTEQLAVLILASLYLQRQWSFLLSLALGHKPDFPEQPFASLWQSRGLPPPVCHYGKAGLIALQEVEQRRRGLPLDFISDWQNQLDHLLFQEEARHCPLVASVELLDVQDEIATEGECSKMSMRHNVIRADIERFLNTLGRMFHKPGRLYLVGGAAIVHMGLRTGSTLDIDVAIESPDEGEMVTAIRRIVEQMQINVEFASPEDFIPLPAQWKAQAKYIGRYGSIDVFYFDFYSLALSKISRGSERDLIDVKLLVQQKVISLEELDAAYHEVLPRMGIRPYLKLNPRRFAERYAIVRQQLAQTTI